MIAFNFDYYRPASIKEAINAFQELDADRKEPVYYSGGTEIITMARKNDIFTRAVIDIKGIPECNVFELQGNDMVVGSALTLTHMEEINSFPLLSDVSKGIADHTARDKITVGGNICGRIIYREAVLPFLISDSLLVLAGRDSIKRVPINEVFKEKLNLLRGEFLVQMVTDISYVNSPFIVIRKTRIGKEGYPLLTAAAIKKDGNIRIAFTGLASFPFRSLRVEEGLNDRSISIEERADKAINNLEYKIVSNIQGSAEYKRFVLRNVLLDILKTFEEV